MTFTEADGLGWDGIVVEAGGDFTADDIMIKHATVGLTVEGSGTAELLGGSQLWHNDDGAYVLGSGHLSLDGATVEGAASGAGVTVFDGATASIANSTLRDNGTGLDVRSSAGTTVTGSTIRHNTTGIRADIVQAEPGAPVPCFSGCTRSILEVEDSVIRNNSGIGLAAYFADVVEVRNTEIRDNSSYGIYASSATIGEIAFTNNLVVSNGSTGALAGTGADLFLSPDDVSGLNRIASNATSEVAVAQGGFAFLGDDTGDTGDNAVFDPAFDPSSGFRLVKNDSKTTVDANFVYWGQPGGPPQGAFTGPVDGTLALSCDPIYPPAPDDPNPCAASRTGSLVEVPGDSAPRRQGLGARIRALRAQLAAAPDASGADTLVYGLGGLHRLDRDDTLGEWAATRALLAALRGALVVPELPAGARAVGEASLEVEAVRLLQRGKVAQAMELLDTWGEHVASTEVRQTLALVAAALHSRTGDYAEAAALAEAAAAEEEDEEMRQSVEALAAHYAMRAAEAGGREADPAQSGRYGEASARAGAQASSSADVNLAVYPNPVGTFAQSTVAVALAERADVRLAVYDVLGRRVAVLHSGALAPGAHRFVLDARALPAGVYVVRAEVGGSRSTTQALTERVTVVR